MSWSEGPEAMEAVAFESSRAIRKVKPVYPEMARITLVQGTVRFRATIGRDGAVEALELVSGPPLLVQAAREAVEQWIFLPATRNGDAVEDVTQVALNFELAK
ncbi:MAG TPA: energy transducer TonB [Bryobacteraceae bacterium]|nr:energy transducer TonB [Bryobacteraceae bacterium]